MIRTTSLLASAALLIGLMPAAASAERSPHERYIVGLKGVSSPKVADEAEAVGVDSPTLFRSALRGYAGELSRRGLQKVRRDPDVRFVERDRRLRASVIQTTAPWGLDRIDQRQLPLNGRFRYTATGRGVTAYIIDSGIRASHAEFDGRATSEQDFVDPSHPNGPYYNDGKDCNGHGTHVAGTVGGETYGVAKDVSLVSVRVLDCDGLGLTSEVIDGIDWVTAQHAGGAPAVANMSFGGARSRALETAVAGSIQDGISYVAAAGNGDVRGVAEDACASSPGHLAPVMTVGATRPNDQKAPWSNFGECVDWFAPGVGVKSAWFTGDGATQTHSGTSVAAPHTTGAAAAYLETNPTASRAEVRRALYQTATKNVVTFSDTRNNHLLYAGF